MTHASHPPESVPLARLSPDALTRPHAATPSPVPSGVFDEHGLGHSPHVPEDRLPQEALLADSIPRQVPADAARPGTVLRPSTHHYLPSPSSAATRDLWVYL